MILYNFTFLCFFSDDAHDMVQNAHSNNIYELEEVKDSFNGGDF